MQMSKRTKLVMAVVFLVVALLTLGYFALPMSPGSRITPSSIQSITVGMTQAEVEMLLGVPPGDYDPDSTVESLPESFVVGHAIAGTGKHWIGFRAAVFVTFDKAGRVVEICPLAVHKMSPNLIQKWRQKLGL